MRWKQNLWMYPTALLFGLWMSISNINPYGGIITLTSLVYQLSGSSGEFVLGFGMAQLLSFTLLLLPSLMFQALAGISFYRHYCTASVYVFSRMPNRRRWYGKECAQLALETLLYQALILAAAIALSAVRWTITDLAQGIPTLALHLVMWSLWTFAFTLGVNLLAIYVGSSTSFAILAGVQMAWISALITIDYLKDVPEVARLVQRLNPVTCLILNWQTSRFSGSGGGIYWEDSLALVLVVTVVLAALGGYLVQNHDLLVSNTDGG